MTLTRKESVQYARNTFLNGKKIKPEYQDFLSEFMGRPDVVAAQYKACAERGNKAWDYCLEYGLESQKAFCFFFDVVVQNGSMKRIPLPENYAVLYGKFLKEMKGDFQFQDDEETKKLCALIYLRAVKNRWRKDVLRRKGTIAHAEGKVHGKFHKFEFVA